MDLHEEHDEMTKRTGSFWSRITAVAAVVLGLTAAAGTALADGGGAYWDGPYDRVWRNGWGECWRSIHWTPETATKECDPHLFKEEPKMAEPEPEPEPMMKEETIRVTLQAETLFDFDKAILKPEGRSALDKLARRIGGLHEFGTIRITGHADRIGNEVYNEKLSLRRAQAVLRHLESTSALSGASFSVRGMGERQPVVTCPDKSGGALIACLAPNRRVDVEVSGTRRVEQ